MNKSFISKNYRYKNFGVIRIKRSISALFHLLRTQILMKQATNGKNGGTNCSLVSNIFASQLLRIASMLFTFTGENKYVS